MLANSYGQLKGIATNREVNIPPLNSPLLYNYDVRSVLLTGTILAFCQVFITLYTTGCVPRKSAIAVFENAATWPKSR